MQRFLKTCIQNSWMLWERGFKWTSRFRCWNTFQFGICTVMIRKHRGARIVCEDSTIIREGDWIGEIHLNNHTVLQLIRTSGPDLAAIQSARLLRKSMQQISRAFDSQPEFRRVSALVGISLLHRGLIHGLGFETQTMKPDLFQKITTSYLRLLLSALHPEGRGRIGRRTEVLIPMRLVHTRMSLNTRFSGGRMERAQAAGE
ncbi:YkoP family protein [Paenibacillus pinihumi]|uniref:YkoP family protein n=1 Tax=Paenibacillus pinihumi TaxID=669462 RepID=UPI0004900111|nr:hypothetical protein [Paenibacillus pinihumi]